MSEPDDTAGAVAEAIPSPNVPPAWHYVSGGRPCGPVTDTELVELRASGTILPVTLVWRPGFADWIPFSQLNARVPMGASPAQRGVILAYSQGQEDPTNIFGWWWRAISRDYANFRGRARRKEFWSFALVYMMIILAPMMLGMLLSSSRTNGAGSVAHVVLFVVVLIAYLGSFVPYLALVVRRLHDTGRSGFWFLIAFLPYVGGLVLLIFLVQDSENATNAYGPNPKSALRGRT